MENSGELHLWNMDPYTNKRLRAYTMEKYGSLKGNLSIVVTEVLEEHLTDIAEDIRLVGDLNIYNSRDYIVRHAHENNYYEEYGRKFLFNRFSAFKLNNSLVSAFKAYVLAKYDKLHSALSREFSIAVELFLRKREGTVSVAMSSIDHAKRVLRDHMVSPLEKQVVYLTDMIAKLVSEISELKRGDKTKNECNAVSVPSAKYNKAVKVLDGIKKYKKVGFTRLEYGEALMKVTGQGDDRTIDSDLKVLLKKNDVMLGREAGLNGGIIYKFEDNAVYGEFQGEEAMRSFVEKFKHEFKDNLQTSRKVVEEFIGRVTGLNDIKSLSRRLSALMDAGYLVPFGPSGMIFNINI